MLEKFLVLNVGKVINGPNMPVVFLVKRVLVHQAVEIYWWCYVDFHKPECMTGKPTQC